MLRLTKRMEDGSYQANNDIRIPGENSYDYKNMIVDRCGRSEDLINDLFITIKHFISEEDKKWVSDFLKDKLSDYGFENYLH